MGRSISTGLLALIVLFGLYAASTAAPVQSSRALRSTSLADDLEALRHRLASAVGFEKPATRKLSAYAYPTMGYGYYYGYYGYGSPYTNMNMRRSLLATGAARSLAQMPHPIGYGYGYYGYYYGGPNHYPIVSIKRRSLLNDAEISGRSLKQMPYPYTGGYGYYGYYGYYNSYQM